MIKLMSDLLEFLPGAKEEKDLTGEAEWASEEGRVIVDRNQGRGRDDSIHHLLLAVLG
jgi:hypothetical protein